MSSYKNIASAAAADVCLSPKRSPIDSSEPSTPPSGGLRYGLRSYSDHQQEEQQQDDRLHAAQVAPVQVAPMRPLEGEEEEGPAVGSGDSERANSESSEEEEHRELARLVAPAPEEVRVQWVHVGVVAGQLADEALAHHVVGVALAAELARGADAVRLVLECR